ncbi:MAG TPA: cyclic nucleotide-binding domain-containing protein [Armatimonadota bacterium]|jgi:CRP-like cAMP-binding protein
MEKLGIAPLEAPSPETIRRELADHPFVSDMEASHLTMLANIAQHTHFDAGRHIFQEGDPADRLFLLTRGCVSLEVYSLMPGSIPLQSVGAGEVLGWSWFVPPYRWRFDAKAVQPTDALCFDTKTLLQMCEDHNDFGYDFMKRMAAIVEVRLNAAKEHLLDVYAHRK